MPVASVGHPHLRLQLHTIFMQPLARLGGRYFAMQLSANGMASSIPYTRNLIAVLVLLLALAGCSSSGDWFHQGESIKPEPLTNQVIPQVAPQQAAPNKSNLSPAARAAAPTENESKGELMDCVTESCKINCSAKVAVRFRPKWCAHFKEPI